jgi:thioredoxin 1
VADEGGQTRMTTITFPAGRSVGRLIVAPADRSTSEQIDATGTVDVPDGGLAVLQLTDADTAWLTTTDLSALTGLFCAEDVSLDDGDLAAIASAPGITVLNARGDFTADGIGVLTALEGLAQLVITTSTIGRAILAPLGQLPALRMLVLTADTIEPGALAAIGNPPALDMLVVMVETLTLDHVTPPPAIDNLKDFSVMADAVEVDALRAVAASNPGLTGLLAKDREHSDVLDAATQQALRREFPQVAVNRTWYAKELLENEPVSLDTAQLDEEIHPVELTAASWDDAIAASTPVLVDFWAEWCGPCKRIAPTIHALASELAGTVTVAKLDVDAHKEIADRYGVMGIPALLVFRQGEVVARLGSQTREAILHELAPVVA